MTGFPMKRGNLNTDRHAQEEDDGKTQGEDSHLQAKKKV